MAQSEEDALFMVTASVLPDVPNSDSKSIEVIDDGVTAVVSHELEEERVFTQISERGEQQEHR